MGVREWMGVEPTRATSAAPPNGFEDRGAHRDSTTPTDHDCSLMIYVSGSLVKLGYRGSCIPPRQKVNFEST